MDDLVQWLRAQLDEDERTARAAAEPEQWVELNRAPQQSWSVEFWADPDRAAVVAEESSAYPVVVTTQGMVEEDAEARAAHIARHDPARVLREIDAKRQLIDLHGLVHRDLLWVDENSEERTAEIPVCGHCVPRHSSFPHPSAVPQGPCATLRLLALPYADRPGYRDAWRP